MKYTIDTQEKYAVLKITEEKLDSTLSPDIKSEFINIHANNTRNLIVDLSDVKYSDSSGLSALLVGNRIFSEQGGSFVLAAVNDHVMKLIKISMLDKVLNIQPTVEEGRDSAMLNELENDLRNGKSGDEA